MLNTIELVRLNLHLRKDHIHRLSVIASRLAKRKGRDTRLAEAIELALIAGCAWSDCDLLDLARPDHEQPSWLRLGAVIRKHYGINHTTLKRRVIEGNRTGSPR